VSLLCKRCATFESNKGGTRSRRLAVTGEDSSHEASKLHWVRQLRRRRPGVHDQWVVGKSKRKGPRDKGSSAAGGRRSESDRDALREALSDVKPLGGEAKKRVMPSDEQGSSRGSPISAARAPPEPLLVERDSDGSVLGRRKKTHPSITDTLADPRLEIEAECDLHGMTAAEADRRVLRFVRDHQQRGHRWVLIIVGKGLHSPDGKGTLREHIVGTLSKRAAARYVLAFCTAPRSHGGKGAFAVRLVDRL